MQRLPSIDRRQRGARDRCVLSAWALAAWLSAAGVLPAAAENAAAEQVEISTEALYARHRKALAELSLWCKKQGLAGEARLADTRVRRRDPLCEYVFPLPQVTDLKPPGAAASDATREFHRRFAELRKKQAAALLDHARRAAAAGKTSLAYRSVCESIYEDPDYIAARRALGYTSVEGRWLTDFEVDQHRRNRVWHKRFGWIAEADVKRYEEGWRRLGRRWISAEEDARRHRDIGRGWKIESEHFEVTTNHSLEEGVRLAAELERLHRAWRQLFAGFYITPAEMTAMLARGANPSNRRKHKVVHFKNREQYVAGLRRIEPKIGITLGIYLDRTRTAYFFAGEDQDAGTVYHEATHQLFKESSDAVARPGRRDHFWVLEAIACYMESIRDAGGVDVLGGLDAGRVPAARVRLLESNFYIPFGQLVALGADSLQSDPHIATIYSQIAGQAFFLMHADGARHRDALVEYLRLVYTAKAGRDALADATGRTHEQLDRDYAAFLRAAEAAQRRAGEK